MSRREPGNSTIRTKDMGKALRITLWTVVAVVLIGAGVFCYGGWQLFGDEIKAMRTLEQLDEGIYTYTFHGDYGFKQFLEQGGAKTDTEMAKYIANFLSKGYMKTEEVKEVRFEAGCSTVQSGNLFCRSFDFGDKGQQMVIVRTYPDEGYASLSTSSFAFIGLGDEWRPVSGMDGMTALATTYIPMDGINEKGLCVADLIELDGDTTEFDSDKPDLTIVGAIRLVLDYAADVEEAIELLGQYDVHNSIGWRNHLAIADRRRSVVVEWKEGEMHVTDTPIVTNHCMWEPRTHPLNEESKRRLTRLTDLYNVQRDDVRCTKESALAFLQEAAYDEWTIWSLVYDRDSLSGTWFIRRAWSKPHKVFL